MGVVVEFKRKCWNLFILEFIDLELDKEG